MTDKYAGYRPDGVPKKHVGSRDEARIEAAIERSSLGTPEAKRYRAMTDPETARRIVDKAFGDDQEGQ